ncbi:oxygen-independent coproporphyrinogen III oxidase [Paenibacillus mesophilus]|uniref:radical SAM family heme chaperone HemW n=1 Tax=Paenibacillus mesophilus TaxID=2582849 RepID=UPI00110E71E5|nr:radical SAM family heme chaperone HemW [Paenibacillus mesophilus]TMV43839.1 oxygen-independent coproporphyrinogen III oxidase [Paenibacillus mesophilus]
MTQKQPSERKHTVTQPEYNQAPPRAVYIHIPFCTNKCHYCDFNSYVVQGQPVMDYLRALEREMELTAERTPAERIESIFIGGGTPTVLTPEQMRFFLGTVNKHFGERSSDCEITMEANPGTTDAEKLMAMREGGVNRISFGVQSFDNKLLSDIGRIHTTDDVYRSIDNARKAGFDNLSIDLMLGLPNQTVATLNATIDEALRLGLEHYSAYSLKIEENTLFHTLYHKNKLPLPDEDEELDMYLTVMRRMREAGYDQYEISNFAKPGRASRHNQAYWRNLSYYGLGAGAHGYIDGTRHVNIKGVQAYIDACKTGLPVKETNEVSRREAMEDFMMVGLRLLSGVSNADFRSQFGIRMEEAFGEQLDRLLAQNMLLADENGYRLSEQGILFGNDVFGAFLADLEN